jgi:hypothetical protein
MISRSTKFTFGNSWARIAALCFFLLLVPALWNLAVVKWDHFRNPVPGAFYEVDGAQMHIDCTGSGSPPRDSHVHSDHHLRVSRGQNTLGPISKLFKQDA